MILDLELLALIPLACMFYLAYAYYDPELLINGDKKEILSIASGTVSSIQTKDDLIEVDIDVGLFDNSILRSPINGTVQNLSRVNGVNLSTSNILSNSLNSRVSFDIVNDEMSVRIEIIENKFSFGLETFIQNGSNLKIGDRLGLCVQSKIRLFLPKDILLNIDLNSDIKQGESIIGFCK
jgi:hypothetical protein